MKGALLVAGGSCLKSPKSTTCICPNGSSWRASALGLRLWSMIETKSEMVDQQAVSIMLTSSSSNTSISIRAKTLMLFICAKSNFVLYSVSRSNMVWIVLAHTSVPSISTFAEAMPVGADALAFLPLTMHQRKTVVNKKDLPVLADA